MTAWLYRRRSYLAYNNDADKRQSGRLVGVVRVRRQHYYCLIIVDRGDGRASLINPRPRCPCRPRCLRHLARPQYGGGIDVYTLCHVTAN